MSKRRSVIRVDKPRALRRCLVRGVSAKPEGLVLHLDDLKGNPCDVMVLLSQARELAAKIEGVVRGLSDE